MTSSLTPPRFADTERWLADVPDVDRFLTVEDVDREFAELAERAPDLVRTRQIGNSRLGEPLLLTSIGHGSRNAMVVSGVHPNEVACFHTAAYLARLVVDDELFRERYDYTWHFVHDLDPDGTRLNERWFDRPGDFEAYTRDFFRPAPTAQPEWTFPTSYKRARFDDMLPETRALARVIDDIRPEYYVSLHGSEAGGAYWYVSQSDTQLIDDLHLVAEVAGVDVDRGEAESAHLAQLAEGIYLASRFAADYDAAEAAGEDPTAGFLGSSSTEYAADRGAATLIPEVPYWTPVEAPTGYTSEPHATMLNRTARDLSTVATRLAALLETVREQMTIPSPFWAATLAFVPMIIEDAAADMRRASAAMNERRATAAETASRETRVRGFVLRYGGMFRRALQVQVDAGLASPSVRAALVETTDLVNDWLARDEPVRLRALPVRSLVALQVGSVLVTADEIARRRSTSDLPHA